MKAIFLVSVLWAASQTPLAQAANIPGADNIPFKFDVTSLAGYSFLAWYAWYTTAKSNPRMVKDQQAQISELIKNHQAQVDGIIKQYSEELTDSRKTFQQSLAQEREYSRQQLELLRDRVHEMAALTQEMMMRVATAVHEVALIAGVIKPEIKKPPEIAG